MAQARKLETEVVIASSGDLFYESFSKTPHKLLNLQPEVYQGCELLEGEFGKSGYVVQWKYTLGSAHYVVEGKSCAMKTRFETIDRKNKVMKLVVLEGDVLVAYKSFEVTIRVLNKEKGVNAVKWSFEYEKAHESMPDPHSLLEAAVQATKKIDMGVSSHICPMLENIDVFMYVCVARV